MLELNAGLLDSSSRTTLVVLMTVAAGLCLVMVWPFAGSIIAGAVLAVLFLSLHTLIRKRMARPSLAAVLSTLLVLIAFLVPLALLVATVLRELREAYQALAPVLAERGRRDLGCDGPPSGGGGELARSGTGRTPCVAGYAGAGSRSRGVGQDRSRAGAASGGVVEDRNRGRTLYCAFLCGGRLHDNAIKLSPLGPQRTETLLETVHQMVDASFLGDCRRCRARRPVRPGSVDCGSALAGAVGRSGGRGIGPAIVWLRLWFGCRPRRYCSSKAPSAAACLC